MIGGPDYTVNTIHADQVTVAGTFYIAVAGKYTLNENSVSSAFFYLIDGVKCQVTI